MKARFLIIAACASIAAGGASAMEGKAVYAATCTLCHETGLAGAPKKGNPDDWQARIKKGTPALYESALHGTAKGMPAKGGNTALSDADVKSAVDYLVAMAKASPSEAKAPAAVPVTPPEAKRETKPIAIMSATKVAMVTQTPLINVNSFNRLLKPIGQRNLPPLEDGIHDPANDGTAVLQPPATAFGPLPKDPAGNGVNWVKALNEHDITPRYDRSNPQAQAAVMDLNIVREVKGSMPNVVYPHKAHTQWLDCSNCHPAIFIPQKGANQISMASILLGQKCGVCHGKVAFPVSECRLCHSRKKAAPTTAEAKP